MKFRLNNLFKSPSLRIKKSCPMLFLSDLHIGGGGPADNSVFNEGIILKYIYPYIQKGWKIIITGDGEELWQFTKKEVYKAHPTLMALFSELRDKNQLVELEGNHNKGEGFPEALIIDCPDPILVVHGHQGDLFNDQWWRVGRFFTRYIWKPLEMVGIKDFTSASKNIKKHNLVKKMYNEWANKEKIILIYGHTHAQEREGYSWNVGCGIGPGKIDVIEFDKELKLGTWV